jgi:hypothetical protein
MLDASIFARSLPALGADPSIGLITCFMDLPDTAEEIAGYRGQLLRQIGIGLQASGKPSVMLSVIARPVTEPGRELLNETGITYLGSGVLPGLRAIGRAFAWADRQERGLPAIAPPPAPVTARPADAPAFLRSRGVSAAPLCAGADIELFVRVSRDPFWGPVIAVGLGGPWGEALHDIALRLLPVTEGEVLDMLSELRGARLLDGGRGRPGIGRQAAAAMVVRIGDAALALGPSLATLEVKPSQGAEAPDVHVVWTEES